MATYLRLFSDVHLDFDIGNMFYLHPKQVWSPTPLPEDHDTILMLAGDLWRNDLAFKVMFDGDSWISWIAKRFEHVVLVLGNHDYWGLSLQSAVRKAREAAALLPNVTLLEQSTATISGIKFVGGTLWTDYGRNQVAMSVGRSTIMDFKYTTFGDTKVRRKIRPEDLFEIHRQTARFIFNNCAADVPGQPVIIMTHMAPHEQSIDPKYAHERMLNASYFTDLSKSIATHCADVKLWVHGHIHRPVDYMIYNVRVLSNPRGYEAYEGTDGLYDPKHQLRIDSL
jgi:Icc-related predicted phosphoesterase